MPPGGLPKPSPPAGCFLCAVSEPACVQRSRNKGFLRNCGLGRERDDGRGASSLQSSAAFGVKIQLGHRVPGRQKKWRCPQGGTSCAVSGAEPLLGSCILPQPIPIHGGLDFAAVPPSLGGERDAGSWHPCLQPCACVGALLGLQRPLHELFQQSENSTEAVPRPMGTSVGPGVAQPSPRMDAGTSFTSSL